MSNPVTRFALLLAACMALGAAPAEAAEPGSAQPRLLCEGSDFDFGRQAATNTVRHTFRIRNEGAAPLAISKVRTSCGSCTVAQLSDTNVPPGTVAELQVEYRLAGAPGEKRTSLYLHTNDPANRIFQLQLHGTALAGPPGASAPPPEGPIRSVPPPLTTPTGFRFDPGEVAFGLVTNLLRAHRTVLLTSTTGKPFHPTGVECTEPGLEVWTETLEDESKYAIHVRVRPSATVAPGKLPEKLPEKLLGELPGKLRRELQGELRISVQDYRSRILVVPVSGELVAAPAAGDAGATETDKGGRE